MTRASSETAFASRPDLAAAFRQRKLAYGDRLRQLTSTIKTALNEQHYDEVQRIAHRLAGTCGLYGFADIGSKASAVAEAVRLRHHDELPHLVDSLAQSLREVDVGHDVDDQAIPDNRSLAGTT